MNLTSPASCSGGVVEYASKYVQQDNNWISLVLQCSFQRPTNIAIIFILLVSLLLPPLIGCCFICFRRCSHCTARPHKFLLHRSHQQPPPPVSSNGNLLKMAAGLEGDSFSQLLRFDHKFVYLLRRPLVHFRSTQLMNFFRLQRPFTYSHEFRALDSLSIANEGFNRSTNMHQSLAKHLITLGDTDSMEMQMVASSSSPSNPIVVDETGSHISSETRWPMQKTTLLISFTTIFLCLLLVATGYTCYSGRQIEMTIAYLPNYMKSVAFSGKRLINVWISETYSLIIGEIRKDVDTNYGSQLRPFIEKMKLSFGMQTMRLYAMTNSSISINIKNATKVKLVELDIFLQRLSTLFSFAPILSHDNIKNAQKPFFSYSYELSRLSPKILLMLSNTNTTDSWRENDLLKRTGEILCKNPTKYFNNCSAIEQQLSLISQQATKWPQWQVDGDLSKVTAYMLVPKLLNAEDYVQKWLPVARDPPSSIPFLFNELVIPEIDKGRFQINRTLDKLSNIFTDTSNVYFNYAVRSQGIIVGFLTFFVGVFFVALIFSLGCCCNRRSQLFKMLVNDERSRLSPMMTICFCLLAVFAVIFCLVGVVVAFTGDAGENQVCVYLFEGEKQQDADKFLFQLLTTLVSKIPALKELKNIKHLNLNLPYPLLTTIDSAYTRFSKPLLISLNMNRPVNLTAVLFSNWLNKTLYTVWHNETWPLMLREKLAEKIPKIQLTEMFAKVRTSMKLDQTFDELNVGNASYYLPKPAINYFTNVASALQLVSQNRTEANSLAAYYDAIGKLIHKYETNFAKVDQALDSVRANRGILSALEPLIKFGDVIIGFLGSKTNLQLAEIFTNLTAEIWLDSKLPISEYIIPIAHSVFDLLLPYPSLRSTYRFVLSPLCSPIQWSTSNISPLFRTLRNFGFALALSSLLLLVFCTIQLMR